jgi:hypothetical protein
MLSWVSSPLTKTQPPVPCRGAAKRDLPGRMFGRDENNRSIVVECNSYNSEAGIIDNRSI